MADGSWPSKRDCSRPWADQRDPFKKPTLPASQPDTPPHVQDRAPARAPARGKKAKQQQLSAAAIEKNKSPSREHPHSELDGATAPLAASTTSRETPPSPTECLHSAGLRGRRYTLIECQSERQSERQRMRGGGRVRMFRVHRWNYNPKMVRGPSRGRPRSAA